MIETAFKVQTEEFEGPLELLLELIEKRKLLINDIALREVADDYLAHIEELEGFPMEDVSHFIFVASTLILIKSKSLLPFLELTKEEEEDIHDLETRLKIYQEMKRVSEHVSSLFGKEVIFQIPPQPTEVKFSPGENLTVSNLAGYVLGLLNSLPVKEERKKAVVRKVISLEEMIDRLQSRITKALKMSFKEFSGDKSEKMDMVVSFLAMLELVKQGLIKVEQRNKFGDIQMETEGVSTPNYGG